VRINELLSDKPTIDDAEADQRHARGSEAAGEIEFRNLDFSYSGADSGRAEVLHSLSHQGSGGKQSRHRGPDRLGQIDAGQFDSAAL
jgi:hypothetical protein